MKNLFRLFVFLLLGMFCLGLNAFADVSNEIAFQGRLTDTAGNAINGSRSFEFTFYNSSGGVIFSTSSSINVNNGLYNALFTLSNTAIKQFGNEVSIEVKVGGTVVGSRTKLTSSPYALAVKDGSITPAKMDNTQTYNIVVTSASHASVADSLTGGGGVVAGTVTYSQGSGYAVMAGTATLALELRQNNVTVGSVTYSQGSGYAAAAGSANSANTANAAGIAYSYSSTAPINTSGNIATSGSITAPTINATSFLNVGPAGSSATFTYNGTMLSLNKPFNLPGTTVLRFGTTSPNMVELSYTGAANGLNVSSHTFINGNLTVTGTVSAGFMPTPSALSVNILSVTSTSTFGGLITTANTGIKIGTGGGTLGTFTWNGSRTLLHGDFTVSGNFSPANLTVTSTSTFGALMTTANTGIKIGTGGGTLGTFTWNGLRTLLQGDFTVSGNFSPANLSVTSTSTFGGLITTANTGIKIGNGSDGTFSWDGSRTNLSGDFYVGGDIAASNISANDITAANNINATTINLNGNNITTNGTRVAFGDIQADKIYAFDVTVYPADLAEIYPSSDMLESGDVVNVSASRDGYIEKSKVANDTKVAGVISTEPGIVLNSGEKGYKLALVGKVPVKVTNEGGDIKRGDLLVASSVPGHAMKATDPKPGTIIGKALENSTGSRGKILALVNLQ